MNTVMEPVGQTPYRSLRPKRFIQVFNRYLQPGGEENSVVRIAAHLEMAGHQVTRFWRSSAEWQGPTAPAKWKQLFLLRNNPEVLNELRQHHASVQPHAWILHNVVPVVSFGIYRLARELDVPIIQWLHNYRPLSPGGALQIRDTMLSPEDRWLVLKEILAGTWRGRFLTAWLALNYAALKRRGDFSSVRAWIAVSERMRGIFARGGFPPSRLFTLRHSWDLKCAEPPDRDEGYFLFLGRLIDIKGVRFLVDLWRAPAFQNLALIFAGEGSLYEELKAKAPPQVQWLGFVTGEAKERLLGRCRAVLFPCLWPEPLSTVAYEAYEHGKPIISSAVGGMKEVVVDGQTGRLLEPGNAAVWEQTVLELARDPALSRRLGLNGRRWLEENVSPASWNKGFDEIMARAIGA